MDTPIPTPTMTPAERCYQHALRNQKKYYLKIRDARLLKYRLDHPNPNPVGRPKKVRAEVNAV